MMRTLFVGDWHDKPDNLPLVTEAAERTSADRIVVLGDICDDWGVSNNMEVAAFECFMDWFLEQSKHREVIPLLGNHDVPYWIPNDTASYMLARRISPGFRPGAHRMVHRLMHRLPMRVAWSDGTVIATHAGITTGWLRRHFDDVPTAEELADSLNGRLPGDRVASLYFAIGPARGGDSREPSPLWADRRELIADGERSYIQVVGHSPVPTVTRDGDFWFCDTFSTFSDGRPIGDGSMLLMTVDGTDRSFETIPLHA